jgi:hypothetical protein
VVISNVHELGANKTTLKRMEQDLNKPHELFSPGDDLVGHFTVPPTPRTLPSAAKGRQVKGLLEKRNEWIFLTPEDYFSAGWTAEEMFDLPEYGQTGEGKKKAPPLERYYERLDRERGKLQAAIKQTGGSDTLDSRQVGEKQEGLKELVFGGQPNPLSHGLSDLEQAVKRLSPGDSGGVGMGGSEPLETRSLNEIFGFGKNVPAEAATDKLSAVEARMQEFKQLLETHSVTAGNPGGRGYNPLIGSPLSPPPAAGFAGLDGLNNDSSRGVFKPLSSSPASQNLLPGLPTAAANFDVPSWQNKLSLPETPRMTLPPPTFNIPQRKF